MTNIFIGLSNNQIKNHEILALDLKSKKQENILITSKSYNVKKNIFNKIIYTNQSFNNQSSGFIDSITNIVLKIKAYKKIIKEIDYYRTQKNVVLYFSYVEDILTNYLLFSFNEKLKGIVVEDGTLNYYYHSIKSLDLKKVYLKKLLCAIYGINFKIYKGHSSGINYNHVEKQYVRSPELCLYPLNSEKLTYIKRKVNLTESFLIIGQESYIHLKGRELYIKRVKELITLIQEHKKYFDIKNIYYKPHRNGERIDYGLIKDSFKDKRVEILDSNDTLEDLYFNNIGSKYIFSFDSSALLNIHLEADETIQSKIEFTVLLKYNTALKTIFKKFNFKVLE